MLSPCEGAGRILSIWKENNYSYSSIIKDVEFEKTRMAL